MPSLAPVSALDGFRGQGVAAPGVAPGKDKPVGVTKPQGKDSLELSPEAQRLVEALKATDARVRAHEAAHLAAAGALAKGGPSFTYQQGPDGKRYAVGGEVPIDTGGVPGNPRATLAKARQIQQAALAPADPSAQDRAIAASAAALAAQAQAELISQHTPAATRPDQGRGSSLDLMI